MSNGWSMCCAISRSGLEVCNVDESFLSLDGMSGIPARGDLVAYGRQIRQRIAQWVGLPVCVGVEILKTLAKFAEPH